MATERQRSVWAWGWADRIADRAGRRALGQQVGALLGATLTGDPVEPPTPDSVDVAAPRVPVPDALADLADTTPAARAIATRGRAWPDVFRGLHNDFATAPDMVLRPRDEQDVTRILDTCSATGMVVVTRGGGTSVVGGVELERERHAAADRGVAVLDLGRLSRVLEVDDVSLHARIQGGALGPDLEGGLAAHGLTLRHYPQSFEFSTLGGWIATRAGGHFATVYTHIDDLVASTRMVTPRGTWQTERLPGSGAGPSPDRLVLGSEGILGVITEAWMRVRPRPRYRGSATVAFADWSQAVEAVRAIAQARLYPTNCRLLDKREAMLHGVGAGEHVLLLAFESAHHPVDHLLGVVVAMATSGGGTLRDGPTLRDDGARTVSTGQAERWRSAFFEAPYLASNLATVGIVADTFETACTWSAFEALHTDVVGSVRRTMKALGAPGLVTCRFTHVYPDGPAPYYTFLFPAPAGGGLEAWHALKSAASDALRRHHATITHHHAVGRTHRPWYDTQRPDLFASSLSAVKSTLDPAGILNPGVLIDG